MKLKQVRLENFRGIESLTLDLHPKLTVLVAENGGGKTTILDGIAKGLTPVLRYLSSPEQRLSTAGMGLDDKDYRLLRDAERKPGQPSKMVDYTRIELTATTGLCWDVQRSKPGVQAPEKTGQTDLKRFCSQKLHGIEGGDSPMLPVFAYYGTGRGNIGIPERLRAPLANYDYPTAALFEALEAHGDFKEAVKWFASEEASELRLNKGRRMEEFSFSPALEAVRASIDSVLGDAYKNPHFDKKNKFVLETTDGSQQLQVMQLSMGYQSMLALAMDFARRLAVGNPHLYYSDSPASEYAEEVREFGAFYNQAEERLHGFGYTPSIMMIDEIDLHLHPAWQQRALDDLMATFPNTQFIVTTHSPQVLSAVRNESIRSLTFNEDGGIVAITPPQQTRGVENAEVLARVMRVNPTPPVKEAQWVNDYISLIENAQADSEEAKKLRRDLLQHFGESHPIVKDCDRLIRFQAFKLKKSQGSEGDA